MSWVLQLSMLHEEKIMAAVNKNFTEFDEITSMADADLTLVWDTINAANKKIQYSNYIKNLIKDDGSIPLTANWDAGSFKITAETFESDIPDGTAPLVIASATLVANLNADLLDGQHGGYYAVDTNTVHLAGPQTIVGVKTFSTGSAIPLYSSHPTFSNDLEIIDKKYADDAITAVTFWNRFIDTPNYLFPVNTADNIGNSLLRISKAWFNGIDVSSDAQLGNATVNAVLTCSNGGVLVLDRTIAGQDTQIQFKKAGVPVGRLSADNTNNIIYIGSDDQSVTTPWFTIDTASGKIGIGTKTPNSSLDVQGSVAFAYRSISATTTLDENDREIEVTANTFTINLPTAIGIKGRTYTVDNSGAGVVTIAPLGSQTIDGNPTEDILAGGVRRFVSNGANWRLR